MNLASWILLVIIILIVIVIITSMIKKSKNGMSPTCSCGCSSCGKTCSKRVDQQASK